MERDEATDIIEELETGAFERFNEDGYFEIERTMIDGELARAVLTAVILYQGREFVHESIHMEKIAREQPEALNWCNVMVGQVGKFQLWSAGQYSYWKIPK